MRYNHFSLRSKLFSNKGIGKNCPTGEHFGLLKRTISELHPSCSLNRAKKNACVSGLDIFELTGFIASACVRVNVRSFLLGGNMGNE